MKLTIQTAAAFERIDDALMGKTQDDYDFVVGKIKSLTEKVKRIESVTNELN
jgi:hypothetical protein